MLILDLDNTIFQTNSINPAHFQPAIKIIEQYFVTEYGAEKSALIKNDLWHLSFDVIVQKYKIPEEVQAEFYCVFDSLEYDMNIQPYADYPALQAIDKKKILVTTGFQKLQKAKITALDIRKDFEQIYIDDPRDLNRIYKQGIFEQILQQEKISPNEVWVIGDNPESELIAGKALGMRTIHRVKSENIKSDYADYSITSFQELEEIL